MRLLYVFLIVALTSACCAQEEELDGDIVDEVEVEVTEPPRSLIRPRRPLKLNRSTKPPSLDESEDEVQTSVATTKATTTKRPASRNRNSARTTKAPAAEENINTTSTKRPVASKNRSRNRNRNRSKNRNRNRGTTVASDDVDEIEATTKGSKRRGGSNGRRTTTGKTTSEPRTTTVKSSRSRTKAPTTSSSRNNRKRTTTPKSTPLTTVADEIKEQPMTKLRLSPRPINLSHFKPTTPTPVDLEDANANIPSKLPVSKTPLQSSSLPPPEPIEGEIDGRLSRLPPPVEVPLKRPLRPIPLEGAIHKVQPIGPLEEPVANLGGLKWEPVGIPPKIVGPVDRTKSGRVQVPSDPQEKEKEKEKEINAEVELPAPALQRPRPSTFRPLLQRPIPTEPAITEEEEELNAFSKPPPSRPDVGVAPKPVGPVSLRPPKRLHSEKDSLSRGSLGSGSRKSTTISADEDNDFPASKSTTLRPKLPRSSSTRLPTKNAALNLEDEDVKPTRRPRTKSTTTKSTTTKSLEVEEVVAKQTRTPYPLRYDDGSPVRPTKAKSSNSGIFSPFEEDLLDDIKGKPTASVFELKDKRVSSQPQSLDGDNGFESRPLKGSNSRKERPLSRSIPTPVPKFAEGESKATSPFRPSKQVSGSSPATPAKSAPRPQAKFTVGEEKFEEKEVMSKPQKKVEDEKRNFSPEVDSPLPVKAPAPIHAQPAINLPPRSRFLTMTADKVPPIQDDSFFVPAADIGKSVHDGEELLIPANRRKEMAFDERKLLPATGELEFKPKQPANNDKNANREKEVLLPKKEESDDGIIMLKPITSRPSSLLEDDVDSLALPPARRVSSFAPPPKPRMEEIPPRSNLQVGIESPSFVIRKPVNLTAPSEADSLPMSKPNPSRSSQDAPPRNAKIMDAESPDYYTSLTHDPRSLAAALPTQRPKSAPKILDSVPESSRSQTETKSREQPKVNPVQPQRTAPIADEAEEYEDEEYEA